jgi:hypothetical protein
MKRNMESQKLSNRVKEIYHNKNKMWKVAQIFIILVLFFIMMYTKPDSLGEYNVMVFTLSLAFIVLIFLNILDILKSKETEVYETKLLLTNKVIRYEKEIIRLKKEIEKLG